MWLQPNTAKVLLKEGDSPLFFSFFLKKILFGVSRSVTKYQNGKIRKPCNQKYETDSD
jgi:hypothetical protein